MRVTKSSAGCVCGSRCNAGAGEGWSSGATVSIGDGSATATASALDPATMTGVLDDISGPVLRARSCAKGEGRSLRDGVPPVSWLKGEGHGGVAALCEAAAEDAARARFSTTPPLQHSSQTTPRFPHAHLHTT